MYTTSNLIDLLKYVHTENGKEQNILKDPNLKLHFKIWNWDIEKIQINKSDNLVGKPVYWFSLSGISNQYSRGYPVKTSKIIKIDFELGIVETQNSIYELQSDVIDWPNDFIKIEEKTL